MERKNVHTLAQSNSVVIDPLTDVLRDGARRLLATALEAEIDEHLARYAHLVDEAGRRRVVRNGYHDRRSIQTGIGSVEVRAPRARDRSGQIAFRSSLLPPYLRKTRSVEALVPWLYLKGISTGEMGSALEALAGRERGRAERVDGEPAQTDVDRRLRGVATSLVSWQALCVLLGRRGSLSGPDGRWQAVFAGPDGSY